MYKNELDKARFQHDMAYELDQACFQYDMDYGDFKDLPKWTASVRVWRDKTFNIVKIPKYDVYQRVLAVMIYKFSNKKTVSLADNLLQVLVLTMRLNKINNLKMNFINQLLETMFRMMI